MILSFSIPAMLPMLWEGLCEIGQHTTKNPVAIDWYERQCREAGLEPYPQPGRAKRQTIRDNSKGHYDRWTFTPDRYACDLYWKSRHPKEARNLGRVRPKSVDPIRIRTLGRPNRPGYEIYVANQRVDIATIAARDGFPSVSDFLIYFCGPKNATFNGVIFRW